MEVGDKKVSMACAMKVTTEKKNDSEESGEESENEKEEKSKKPTASEVFAVKGMDSSFVVELFEAVEKEEVEKGKGSGRGDLIKNPWNAFQHANKGKGWSMDKMREEYKKSKKT